MLAREGLESANRAVEQCVALALATGFVTTWRAGECYCCLTIVSTSSTRVRTCSTTFSPAVQICM
jgi:hypothetical protein